MVMSANPYCLGVAYKVVFDRPMPDSLHAAAAATHIVANCVGWRWLMEQAGLCDNAKLSTDEAVAVIKGRIAYDADYGK